MIFKYLGMLGFAVAVAAIGYQQSKRFLDWLRFQSLGTRDYIVDRLASMFIEIPPQKILMGLFGLSFGSGLLMLMIFRNLMPGVPFAIIMTIIGWKAPKPIVDWLYQRRIKKFVHQMVDALGLMSNGMKSGLSVVQSLGLVTQEMENPIQQEFNLVLSENKLGVSLEDAFINLSKRVQCDDVEMFVTSVNILKETGGNLAETFDTIVSTIRERIKVEAKIDAMTASGKMQGYVVMCIPGVLGAIFYQTDPEFMKPMFTTTMGWVVIMVILALELAGYFVIMKVVKIDV